MFENTRTIYHKDMPLKAGDIQYFDVRDTTESAWVEVPPGLASHKRMEQEYYPCRWDLEGHAKKFHHEVVKTINIKLSNSIHELMRAGSIKLPLCTRRHRGSWNYSVSYRQPGIYLKMQSKMKELRRGRNKVLGQKSHASRNKESDKDVRLRGQNTPGQRLQETKAMENNRTTE